MYILLRIASRIRYNFSVLDPEDNNFFSWSDSVSGFFDIIICTVRALLKFKFKSQLCIMVPIILNELERQVFNSD
jgi:hypothetical protein